jgi:hypothetical protein
VFRSAQELRERWPAGGDYVGRDQVGFQLPGGQTFGYTNVRVNSHAEYQINEPEAAVVRRIFELAAEGRGTRWIARKLNDERVLAPAPRRAGRPRAWAPLRSTRC